VRLCDDCSRSDGLVDESVGVILLAKGITALLSKTSRELKSEHGLLKSFYSLNIPNREYIEYLEKLDEE
jgi:hypothetical protein